MCRVDTSNLTTFSINQKYELKTRTVLNKYIIGKDTYMIYQEKNLIYNKDNIKIVYDDYMYSSSLQLLFFNDTLFGIKYYPQLKDTKKFFSYLDGKYIQNPSYDCCGWYNKYITISYEIDSQKNEFFLFFDKK